MFTHYRRASMEEGTRIRFREGNRCAAFLAMKDEVEVYLRDSGKSPFADRGILLKAVLLGAIALGSYGLLLTPRLPTGAELFLAILYGLAVLALAYNVG